MATPPSPHWDLFCTVIDNYGDIGITWRLARQLAREHAIHVRLWVDDLLSFHALRPEVDPERPAQTLEGVEIRRWTTPLADVAPADVVVEALACELPAGYVQAMARRQPRPVWINLEYLSAEAWVTGCHGLPSPHPRLPLDKWFFFPGYVPGTGGLLREAALTASRRAFQASAAAQERFWVALGLPPRERGETRISLFGYENQAVGSLLQAWEEDDVRCLVPAGRLLAEVARHFGRTTAHPGDTLQAGRLRVHILPMLDQDRYDHLLWACDCNFVRGEDSFTRAQAAARPLVWQAYRQEEAAHWAKINAFLALYCVGLPQHAAEALHGLWRGWNGERLHPSAWRGFWNHREALRRHARAWDAQCQSVGDLATNLVNFCNKKL